MANNDHAHRRQSRADGTLVSVTDASGPNRLPVLSDRVPSAVGSVLDNIINRSISGGGGIRGAVQVAEEHRAASTDRDAAVERLIRTHVRWAAASGFVTGLGGVATLAVSLPAGVTSLYLVAARMTAGISHLYGYDVESDEVRSAIAVCLIGSSGAEAAKQVSIEASRRFLVASLRKMSAGPLIVVNRTVGFRLVTKFGSTGVVNLGKAIPLVGGPVGGVVDAAACRGIRVYARSVFGHHPRSEPAPIH